MEIYQEDSLSLKINRLLAESVRFALYRMPNEKEPTLLVQESKEGFSFSTPDEVVEQEGFLMAPFSVAPEKPIVLIAPEKVMNGEKAIADYLKQYPDFEISEYLDGSRSVELIRSESFAAYEESFQMFIDALNTGLLKKLVLSRSLTKSLPKHFSIYRVFSQLSESHPDEFVFLCNTPETGAWMGCTPERFLTQTGNQWHTVALAGTINEESATDWDDKNKYEQHIVTEYMEEQLSSLGATINQEDRKTVKAGHLLHLATEFHFELPPYVTKGKLFNSIHPTPAVCGFPKKEAYRFIMHNEPNERRYYSGYLGLLNMDDHTDLYVNLRCMELLKDQLRLHAGGGLLTNSELFSEWTETEDKMNTLGEFVFSSEEYNS